MDQHPSVADREADRVVGDRRPIRARDRAVWIGAAAWLARRGVHPNTISIAGMLGAMLAGGLLWATAYADEPWRRVCFGTAATLVLFRLVCNMLDGMVAVNSGRRSPVGELYNEVPDRVSDAAVLAGLGLAQDSSPILGWAAACAAVFVAYIRAEIKVAGAPQDYRGPMAKQQRMAVVVGVSVWLAVAPESWRPTVAGNGWSLPRAALWVIVIGCVITAARRLLRASSILRDRSAP